MKKLVIAVLFSVAGVGVNANPLMDQITVAFVGNAKLAIEFTSRGEMQYAFLDNFIEIGKLNGSPIVGIDFGILGTQLPSGSIDAADWSNGIKLHISPFIKNYIKLQPGWEFINNLEIDGRYSYNWTQERPTLGLSIGYPWR